ncbi:hypothetical protein ACH489_31955 [Streptomyces rubiginosohelvolus]|uniref:hypothetical protein n=1 Tax=Streptomyces rubiginosohelvolus TaxID=67362 RepID=UPI00378BDF55
MIGKEEETEAVCERFRHRFSGGAGTARPDLLPRRDAGQSLSLSLSLFSACRSPS